MRVHHVVLPGSILGFILLVSLAVVPVGCAHADLSEGDRGASRALKPADSATRSRVLKQYGAIPLHFEANRGQTDRKVKFLSRGQGYSLFLTGNEAVLSLCIPKKEGKLQNENDSLPVAVRMALTGSNTRADIAGLEKLPGSVNYLMGNNPDRWRTNVPTYKKVRYRDVYPGIDLIYYGKRGSLEYDLVVNPGADHGTIRIAFDGIDALQIDRGGDLLLRTSSGNVLLKKPIIYQKIDGRTRRIDGGYTFLDKRQVGFRVAEHDANIPLIIDPELIYSTYLGG